MKLYVKITSESAMLMLLAALLILPANAALQAPPGPTSAVNGFPLWYMDTNGLPLALCLNQPQCGLLAQTLTGPPAYVFDPASPVVFPTNFPPEAFYWSAVGRMDVGANASRATMLLALEGSFGPFSATVLDPIPTAGNQITFLRVNFQLPRRAGVLEPSSTYTVTHPFGTFTFTTDATGDPGISLPGGHIRFQDGCAAPPCVFSVLIPATTTNIGPFLTWTPPLPPADPVTGFRFIGDGVTPHTITPGPTGIAVFRIAGPNVNPTNIGGTGVNTLETNLWIVTGKIADAIPPVIVATSAAPPTIDTAGTSVLSVTATDDIGVAGVNVDLTSIGGPANATMTLFSGNKTNGVWHRTVNSSIAGTFTLPVTAIDGGGNTIASTVALNVTNAPIVTAVPNVVLAHNATSVTITVTQGGVPVPGTTVNLTGAVLPATLSLVTGAAGTAVFSVNATVSGTITVTATNPAFLSPAGTTITVSGLPLLIAPFDTNFDGIIQRNEAVNCVVQFFTGTPVPIPRATAVAVVVAFFTPPV